MTQLEILERIAPIFQRVFHDDDLEISTQLTSEEIDEWSSLTQMILLTEIEREFSIKFKLREVALMNDVKTIVEFIEEKTNWV